MLQGRPFIMQLKTTSQQPDLKTSLSQAERYGHHLDAIQCAGLTTMAPIQMLSVEEEEEKLTSGINLELSKLNENNSVPNLSQVAKNPSPNLSPHREKALNSPPSLERKGAKGLGFTPSFPHDGKSHNSELKQVLGVASSLKSFNKKHQKDPKIETEPKEHFNEEMKSATETSQSKDKEKKQNLDEHLTSPAKSKISDNQAKEESSQSQDPEVSRLLNKPTQSNLAGSGGGIQQNNQEKQFVAPPSTYNENKSAPSPKVGTHGQSLAKREAMDMLGNNKRFATTQRAVKIPVSETDKSESSKGEDSKQQVKLKDAAELVRDQVVNEDRQVKEYLRGRLNLDPAIVAKQGGEQLILQKMQ
ncbi:MAG: hypothetical protein KME46_21655 [Brasilonema angustatum HA4187-MV1]|nr:hypothetical protein [Brasilonema angustatum HA4187-MV1]